MQKKRNFSTEEMTQALLYLSGRIPKANKFPVTAQEGHLIPGQPHE